jgi:DNA-binding CsgD family transcriptional regulator
MHAVVGRDRELEAIAAFLDFEPTRAPARILLVQGEPGIGKTTLWRAGVELGTTRGYRILSCAPAGAEAELAFTSLRDLLADVFDEIAEELPAPQRHALDVVLLREATREHPLEHGTVAVAFLTALRALADRRPVLLAVDDIQWIDPESARVLQYALRRLDGESVTVLLARRTREADLLGVERLDPDRFQTLEIVGLTVGALGRILHDRLDKTFVRPTLFRIHEVSAGNAFYALEVARAFDKTKGELPPGTPLPVPGNLRRLVEDRLAALPSATFDVLALAAAVSRPTVRLVAAALGPDAVAMLEPAVEAQVVEVDGDILRFAHPLFASAVYGLARLRWQALHALLADVVTDPEERARHLALATVDRSEEVAGLVEEGAHVAFARGSPATAADLASHAVRLTPPQEPERATTRALAEIEYRFASGDTAGASTLLAALLVDVPPGPLRAQVLSEQARVEHFARDMPSSLRVYYRALAEVGGDDGLRAEIETAIAWRLVLTRTDIAAAVEHGRRAVSIAEPIGERATLAEALAALALAEFVAGEPFERSIAAALALEDAVLDLRVLRHPTLAHAYILASADELDHARDAFATLLVRAESSGDENAKPVLFNHLAEIECYAGRWQESQAHAEEGYERARESGHAATQASILGKKALLAARRGRLGDARDQARAALETAVGSAFDDAQPQPAMARGAEAAIWTLGIVELANGDPEAANAFLHPASDALLDAGVQEPGEMRCLPDAIEALIALGRDAETARLLGRLQEAARRVGRPSQLGAAARCEGLALAAAGDSEGSLRSLELAVACYGETKLPFERARTLLALGTQQRRARQRRSARETLQGAHAIFEELGAEGMEELTWYELSRIGGRAPSSGELTATERRIAELVAEGKKNKEVAATLVISVHTVEAALTRIYQKLDVRSRTELAAQLSKL